jgi:hypothetical protein
MPACAVGSHCLKGIVLPDEDDRHVVAAALRGRADLIVTANLSDFPASSLAPLGLETQGLDDFLLNQLDLDPDVVIRVLHAQAAATATSGDHLRCSRRPPSALWRSAIRAGSSAAEMAGTLTSSSLTSSLSCSRPDPPGAARGRRLHAQRRPADTPESLIPELESVLSESSQGFESPILRQPDPARRHG